jgi:hypothetical protein
MVSKSLTCATSRVTLPDEQHCRGSDGDAELSRFPSFVWQAIPTCNRLSMPRHGGGPTMMRRTTGAVASREARAHQPSVRRSHPSLDAGRRGLPLHCRTDPAAPRWPSFRGKEASRRSGKLLNRRVEMIKHLRRSWRSRTAPGVLLKVALGVLGQACFVLGKQFFPRAPRKTPRPLLRRDLADDLRQAPVRRHRGGDPDRHLYRPRWEPRLVRQLELPALVQRGVDGLFGHFHVQVHMTSSQPPKPLWRISLGPPCRAAGRLGGVPRSEHVRAKGGGARATARLTRSEQSSAHDIVDVPGRQAITCRQSAFHAPARRRANNDAANRRRCCVAGSPTASAKCPPFSSAAERRQAKALRHSSVGDET